MTTGQQEHVESIRQNVRDICKNFPGSYWRDLDEVRGYPTEFVQELTRLGMLSVLIPEEYGGAGLGLIEGGAILEEICKSGGNAAACHAQMYTMGVLLRHGSKELKQRYLPQVASGELRLQAFGVTEPDAGSETTKLRTTAVRKGDVYVVNGQKMFISRVQHSDLMVLLARTTPVVLPPRPAHGEGARCPPAEAHVQPPLHGAVLRQRGDPRREPDRRGGHGLPLHHRLVERGANPRRVRGAGRWLLVHRQGVEVRETRLWSIAPVNNNLVLAFIGQRVLGMPRSY